MKSQLPPRHPPLPPIRICLNLDQIPLDDSPLLPPHKHQSISFSPLDHSLMTTFLKSQFKSKNMGESNFASAFVSQSQLLEQEEKIVIPKFDVGKKPAKEKKSVVLSVKRKETKLFAKRLR